MTMKNRSQKNKVTQLTKVTPADGQRKLHTEEETDAFVSRSCPFQNSLRFLPELQSELKCPAGKAEELRGEGMAGLVLDAVFG